MLSDHSWSALRQIGRIYKVDVVNDRGVNRLRGSVYMMRSDSTNDIIKAIEGGVLKEVSVGFSCKKHLCSECGADMELGVCKNGHRKGEEGRDGRPILDVLDDVTDAFELSFVAVPAQPGAGTTKGLAARKKLSSTEWETRKKILEDSNGVKIPDDIWDAVVAGRVSSLEVVNALRKQMEAEANQKPKHYENIVPEDEDCYDAVEYALIPKSVISDEVNVQIWEALGFCRKDLELPPIEVCWFTLASNAKSFGLKYSELRKFKQSSSLLGLSSPENPNQILLRYPLENGFVSDMQKTVFHECYHTMQFHIEGSIHGEDNAYWYQEDAYNRFCSISAEERKELYFGELLMKDYSKI